MNDIDWSKVMKPSDAILKIFLDAKEKFEASMSYEDRALAGKAKIDEESSRAGIESVLKDMIDMDKVIRNSREPD